MIVPSKKFRQDEDGTWWYYFGKVRTRCSVRVCEWCEQEYLCATSHTKRSRFCSRKCSARPYRGRPGSKGKLGPKSPHWKGGRYVASTGYVMVFAKDHPSLAGTKRKYMPEHRLVMEKVLGRPLRSDERVHHLNGDKLDNTSENLEIVTASDHAKRHRGNHFRSTAPPHCSTCTCS